MSNNIPYDLTAMRAAMEEAVKAGNRNEVPIGAVLVDRETGEIVARNGNRTRELNDPSAHAEMLVIREICTKMGAQRIPGYDLYVTLEPCTLCTAGIAFARLDRVIFGAADPKGGAVISGVKFFDSPTCHHRPRIIGPVAEVEQECSSQLREFFSARRPGR